MSKSVLVIDTPSGCECCPAGRIFGTAGAAECMAGKNTRVKREGQAVPDWCPLEGLEEFLGQTNNAGGWTYCGDGRSLPEINKVVLAQVSGKYKKISFKDSFELAEYSKKDGWVLESWPEWENPGVIAWHELPGPYKGGGGI